MNGADPEVFSMSQSLQEKYTSIEAYLREPYGSPHQDEVLQLWNHDLQTCERVAKLTTHIWHAGEESSEWMGEIKNDTFPPPPPYEAALHVLEINAGVFVYVQDISKESRKLFGQISQGFMNSSEGQKHAFGEHPASSISYANRLWRVLKNLGFKVTTEEMGNTTAYEVVEGNFTER